MAAAGRILAALLLLVVALAPQESRAEMPPITDVVVTSGSWVGSAPGAARHAAFVLAVAADGMWRASIAADPGTDPLREDGEGWTLLGLPEGEVWLTTWRDPSRRLAPAVAASLHAMVAAWTAGERGRGRLVLEPGMSLLDDGAPAAARPLALRLADRATGRGGAAESWWWTSRDDDPDLVLRSRRRPVTLRLHVDLVGSAVADADDFPVPAWSLGTILQRNP